jgi:hypothetical protein
MSWVMMHVPDEGMMVIRSTGHKSIPHIMEQIKKAAAWLQENKAESILVDHTDALTDISLFDVLLMPRFFESLGVDKHVRVAVVVPCTHYRIETYEYFGALCRSQGYNVMLFESKESARHWLRT